MKYFVFVFMLFSALTVDAQWDQIGQDVLGFEEEAYFGDQVSISDDGSTIAVSAPTATGNGQFYNGMVRVYRLSGGLWTQIGSDLIGNSSDQFGLSLSLNEDGNILAVASPYGADGEGSVTVFSFDGNDWTIMGSPIPGIAFNNSAVSLSNDGLTFVANLNTSVFVYVFNGSQWEYEVGRNGIEVIQAVDISADGTKVIYSGQNWFHHFEKIGDTWTNTTNMMFVGDDGTNFGSNFLSLSGDGNVIAKGAELNNIGGTEAGRVVIIDRTNPDEWTFSYITGSSYDNLGRSVSLNHDGSVLSVLGDIPRIYHLVDGQWLLDTSILVGATSAELSASGDIVATGYNVFPNAENQYVGVMRAYGNLPNEFPSLTCPETIQVNSEPDLCGASVVLPTITGNDLEDGAIEAIQTGGIASGEIFPVGSNEVSFSVTDTQGLSATCSFVVQVTDVELPEVVCANVLLELDDSGWASISSDALIVESSDNCGMEVFVAETLDFTCSQTGVNNVTVNVTDIHGNQNSCIAQVTVQDVVAPELNCQNITVELDETGHATASSLDIVTSFSDNCNANLPTTTYDFSCEHVGVQSVTISTQDGAGNVTSCVAEIIVVDLLAPTVTCQDIEVELNDEGEALITAQQVALNSTDNCELTLSLSNDFFSCDDLGTNTVTLQGVDLSGNMATCDAVVTVIDVTPPVLDCPMDSLVSVVAPLVYTLEDFVANQITVGDNCTNEANMEVSQSPIAGTELAVGDHEVTFTVFDASGNESTCSFVITVMVEDGVHDLLAMKLNIYPNPTNGMITISYDKLEFLNVAVFDITGRKVLETTCWSNDTINLSRLHAGEYFVHVVGQHASQMEKVVVR
ncbi:MAG: hypothetical protein RL226_20 [Bacteroidota bacterium]